MRRWFVSLLIVLLPLAGVANEAPPAAEDPVAEARMMKLANVLRCLVCQNQTIADSNADLAVDLRRQIREMIGRGMSDEQIMAYMVERYGNFVLYRPPVEPATWLLWGGPFALLLAAGAGLFVYVAQRRRRIVETPLSEDERRRAEALLAGSDEAHK